MHSIKNITFLFNLTFVSFLNSDIFITELRAYILRG